MSLAHTVAAALAGLLCGAALAQTRDPPLPPPRPGDLGGPSSSGGGDPAGVPLPPPRPADLGQGPPPSPRPADPGRDAPPVVEALPTPAPADPKPAALVEHEACLEALARLGVRFEPMPSIRAGACGAERPLRVSALPEGVEVSPPATTICPVAEALARWTVDTLVPEARRLLDRRPVRLLVGTSYECRGQNRVAGTRLSEHGFANAVDIGGIVFDRGKPHTVMPLSGEAPGDRFQAEIQARACAYFTTVLGPGSDAAHANHLHLDLRGRNRGFRICQ